MQMMEYRAIAPLKIDKSLTARIFKEEKLSLIPIKKIKVIEGVEDDVTNELVQMSKYSKKKVNNFSLSTNSEKQFKQITSTLVFEQKIARDSTEEEQKEKHEQTINLKKILNIIIKC